MNSRPIRRASILLCLALSCGASRVGAATSTTVHATMQVSSQCAASVLRLGVEGGAAADTAAPGEALMVGSVIVTCAPKTTFRLAPTSGSGKLENASGASIEYVWSIVEGEGPFVATGGRQRFAIVGRLQKGVWLPAGRYTDPKVYPIAIDVIR